MTGSMCRRLLAAVLLIFVVQLLSRAQSTVNRLTVAAPALWGAPSLGFDEGWRLPEMPRAPGSNPVFSPVLPHRGPLTQIARPAGVIFSGRVIAVRRSDSSGSRDAASTAITFQIERAIRGVSAGQKLTIHEWAGLWARGERYRVGQRVMLFLFPPSKLGFTSPVAGPWGRFDIDPAGRVVLNAFNAGVVERNWSAGGRNFISYPEFVLALRKAVVEE
jgi:hypothetical protein